MGAINFMTTAKGRTAQEAFRAAREDALHWEGHGGYTGSVAEKHDIVMVADTGKDLKVRLDLAIKGLRDLQRKLREPGPRNVADALQALQRRAGAYFEIDEYVLRSGSKVSAQEELQREVARLREIKAGCRARMKPGDIANALLDIRDKRVDDKWGPAGCIDMTPRKTRDKEFLFFGIASC